MIQIREAGNEDVDAIAQLKVELDEYHKKYSIWPPECDIDEARQGTEKHLKKDDTKIFVADTGLELAGYASAMVYERETVHPDYARIGMIHILYVKPEYWRQGIGTEMMKVQTAKMNLLQKWHYTVLLNNMKKYRIRIL